MIRDVLVDELVEVDVDVSSWQECVRYLGQKLVKAEKIKEAFIDSMIDTVNELGPYMILLPRLAFFHGKPGELVKEPCLSFITLKEEVTFEEFEGQKIKCAFAFGAVDSDSHMQMLMQVAQILQDEAFIDLVMNNGSKSDIMKKIQEY